MLLHRSSKKNKQLENNIGKRRLSVRNESNVNWSTNILHSKVLKRDHSCKFARFPLPSPLTIYSDSDDFSGIDVGIKWDDKIIVIMNALLELSLTLHQLSNN